MRYIFKFPDIGEGVTEGKILEWLVRAGQEVNEGDPLVKMETDKVVADLPSPKKGKVVRLFGKIGEIARVDEPLVEIEIAGPEAEIAGPEAEIAGHEAVEESGFGVVGEIETAGDAAFLPATGEGFERNGHTGGVKTGRKALATPVARVMAKDLGLDIDEIPGTGPGGRVMKADIKKYYGDSRVAEPVLEKAAVEQLSDDGVEYEEISQIRKTIAARMAESKSKAPHMTAMEKV